MSNEFVSPDPGQFLDDESWQPDKEDGLLQTDADDILEEGVSAAEEYPLAGLDLSQRGQVDGEPLLGRLGREEPDDVDGDGDDEYEDAEELGGDDLDDDADRMVGRLVALPDDDDSTDLPGETQSILAQDAGVAGGDLSAEEAAMHVVGDDTRGGLTDDEGYGAVYDERR